MDLFLPFNLDGDASVVTLDAKIIPIPKFTDNLATSGFHFLYPLAHQEIDAVISLSLPYLHEQVRITIALYVFIFRPAIVKLSPCCEYVPS